MVVSASSNANTQSADEDDISVTLQSNFPTKTNAFARISIPKKSFLEQIRDAQAVGPLALDLPTNEYPLITGPENRKYKLRAHFYGKPRPSWIQQHGTLLLRLVPGSLDTQDGQFWACNQCGMLYDAEATSSAGKHLVNRHRITKDGEVPSAANNTGKRQIPIDEFVATPTNKRIKLPPYMEQKDGFKELLVNWMADSDIPFSVVENKRFRALLSLLNPVLVNELLPKSHNTARSWLNTIYAREFNALKQDLLATPNPIHISFDGWSSPGTATFLAVVAHYFDTAGIFHTTLIALPRIKGTHNGENLAKGVIEVIERFGFQSKLGFFQADNAENNDTCITELLKHFNPYLSSTQIDILQSCKRVRCVGHILNLIARAFLDGENKETIKKLAKGSDERLSAEHERELLVTWRETGPLGKLQYLVHFARRTPQRKDAFNDFTHGKLLPEEEAEFGAMLVDPAIRNLQLKADNDTRWHSVYHMIERALLLREPLTQFSARYNRLGDLCDEAILSSEDWAVLTEVKAILAPFKFITKKFEGRKPNLSDVVTHIFSLHRDLKHLHREYAATFERSGGFDSSIFPPNNERPTGRLPAFLVPMAQERPQRIRRVPTRFTDYEVDLPGIGRGRTVVAAWPQGPHIELGTPLHDDLEVTSYSSLQSSIKYAIDKLEKYMEILDETPAYWAALILHPGRRMKWVRMFYRNEDSHRIQQIQRLFVSYFDEHYATTEVPSTQLQPPQPPDDVDGFGDDFYDNPITNDVVDEVGEYLRGPVLPVDDPVQWWKVKASDFPRLSKMALEILSIPPCATECERTFSLTKLAIGSQRHSTGDDALSELQCVRSWLRVAGG